MSNKIRQAIIKKYGQIPHNTNLCYSVANAKMFLNTNLFFLTAGFNF